MPYGDTFGWIIEREDFLNNFDSFMNIWKKFCVGWRSIPEVPSLYIK